jgi:hypothetical protein
MVIHEVISREQLNIKSQKDEVVRTNLTRLHSQYLTLSIVALLLHM